MPIRLSAYGRRFAPSWPMTLLTAVLLVSFVSLGRWQWHRAEAKQSLWDAYERGATAPARTTIGNLDESERFARVALRGHFDSAHQFLLDNISQAGKPGYEVLTLFALDDGRRILVNRGWVPFTGYRDRLPDITLHDGGSLLISGRLDELPAAGLALGHGAPSTDANWPKVTSFPTHQELESVLGQRIARRVLLLDPQEPAGYVRAWSPPGLAPARHYSYAIQWWGFAVVLLVLYFGLNFRKVS
jgi:surfeit locus 1 family protein